MLLNSSLPGGQYWQLGEVENRWHKDYSQDWSHGISFHGSIRGLHCCPPKCTKNRGGRDLEVFWNFLYPPDYSCHLDTVRVNSELHLLSLLSVKYISWIGQESTLGLRKDQDAEDDHDEFLKRFIFISKAELIERRDRQTYQLLHSPNGRHSWCWACLKPGVASGFPTWCRVPKTCAIFCHFPRA